MSIFKNFKLFKIGFKKTQNKFEKIHPISYWILKIQKLLAALKLP